MKKYILLTFAILPFWLLSNTLTVKRIDINQGLSNNYCQGMALDRNGVLWFGTESGLNRFDGNEFKTFYSSETEPNSINSNELNDIYADKKEDIIWVGTEHMGLNAYNYATHQFSYFRHNVKDPTSLASDGVMALSGESSGNIWVSTYEAGVDLLDKKNMQFIHYNQSTVKGLGSNYTRCAIDDNHGNLYVGHLQGGMSIISIKKKTAINFTLNPTDYQSIPSQQIFAIYIDSRKRVWVGTDNGLALFNKDTKKFNVFRRNNNPGSLRSNFITSINEINNEIWIGTTGGLEILAEQYGITEDPARVVFRHLPASENQEGLSYPIVNSILQDSYKNVWITTYGGGINFLSNKAHYFNVITHSQNAQNATNLEKKIVLGLCYTSQNELWIGTDGGGIDVFKNGIKIHNYSMETNPVLSNRIVTIYEDSRRNIWIGTDDGKVLSYNTSTKQFKLITSFQQMIVQVRGFYEDSYHNLWIAAENGLFVLNLISGEKRAYNDHNSPLRFTVIRAITGDNQGRIWIGLLSGGLQIFTPDFKLIRSFTSTKDFYGINHIFRDSKNRMWVSTRQRLILFQNCTDTNYIALGMKDGLMDNYIRAAAEGPDDKIWISTNRGISCLNEKNRQIKNYNPSDGIPAGNFSSGAVAKSKDGTIYFGSENGLCYFNSNESLQSFELPPVLITGLSVLDKKNTHTGNFTDMPISKDIHLNYNQSTITLQFNIPDYSLNDMVEFSYQLKGLDDTWYNIQSSKSLVFRNLRPGKYVFSIKSRLRNQDWSNRVTTLEIHISPPFWLSWWAETCYAIIILLITFNVVRFYKNKVNLENSLMFEKKAHQQEQELNEERLQFYTNITHELRTPLTLIIGPLEDIVNDKTVEPVLERKIASIHRSANRLLGLINQILEFRKSETRNRKLNIIQGSIAGLIQEIGMKYKELNQNKNTQVQIQIDPNLPTMYYDAEVLTIILDNLLSNALKYTPKGLVNLSIHAANNGKTQVAEIAVSDTGYGIAADVLPRVFDRYYQVKGEHQMSGTGIGLSLVKNMVELHQGSIRVESTIGKGTTFTVSLLTNNTYPEALHTALLHNQQEVADVETLSSQNPLMLVIEDNQEICEYIRDCFSEFFEVLLADNGKKGLEIALERTPDIIISDIMMPVMDGMELCRRIKADVKTSHIPVILLTAKDSIQDKTEGYTVGADSYITKPFSAKLLQSRVTNILETRKKISAIFTSPNLQKQELLKDSLNELDHEFLEKITAIIESNLESEQINIAQIADRLFMSHSTLYRKLKALTGLTINEFIRKIRMGAAEKLLLTGKYKINEVMYMVGISSPNYFRECFKEEFGVTPTEHLQNIKNGKTDVSD